LKRYSFGRLRDLTGVAAFFKLRKKSLLFGIGISCPLGVVCVFCLVMRQCLFCERNANTREHVLPDWILERLKGKRKMAIAGYVDGRPVRVIGIKPELKAKFVCKTCNNGWICSLEEANRPLLGSLLRDIAAPIDTIQQWSVARWAVKTIMVMESLGSRKQAFYTRTEREQLAASSTVFPKNTNVWLGRYSGNNDLAFTGMHLWDDKPESPKTIHCYVGTIVFGYLVIQLFTAHVPADYERGIVKARPAPWDRLLVRTWPTAKGSVDWPPALTFDDRNIGLGDLVERFKGESAVSL